MEPISVMILRLEGFECVPNERSRVPPFPTGEYACCRGKAGPSREPPQGNLGAANAMQPLSATVFEPIVLVMTSQSPYFTCRVRSAVLRSKLPNQPPVYILQY